MSLTEALRGLNRFITLATDRRVISAPVIIACAILSVLIHLAPNGSTVEGSVWVRITVATIAYVPGLALIAIFASFAYRLENRAVTSALMLLSFFMGGALRGVVLAVSFFNLGMADSLYLDFRIPASAIPFGLAISLATYAVAALDDSKRRIASLRALENELNEAVRESSLKNSALRDRTVSRIEESIQHQLAPLTEISSKSSAADLRELAATVVRPLSHQLAKRIPNWAPSSSTSSQIRFREIFRQIRPELSFKPTLLTVLTIATGVTAFIYFFGIELAIPLLIFSSVMLYLTVRVIQELVKRLPPISNTPLRFLAMTVLLMISAIPAGLVDIIIIRGTSDPTFFLRAALVIVPLFGWFIALGGAAQAESNRIESEYNHRIEELSWLKARLNLLNWYEQGELARILHGPVQSVINKGVIRLGREDASNQQDILSEVEVGIENLLAPISRWTHDRKSLQELADELAFTLEDICRIDISLSPSAEDALRGDLACAALSWDVIHDSCNNAIQHGKANWVSIRVANPVVDQLQIEVLDNGAGFDQTSRPGLGSALLDSCCLSWSRERKDNQTVLTACLPIASE